MTIFLIPLTTFLLALGWHLRRSQYIAPRFYEKIGRNVLALRLILAVMAGFFLAGAVAMPSQTRANNARADEIAAWKTAPLDSLRVLADTVRNGDCSRSERDKKSNKCVPKVRFQLRYFYTADGQPREGHVLTADGDTMLTVEGATELKDARAKMDTIRQVFYNPEKPSEAFFYPFYRISGTESMIMILLAGGVGLGMLYFALPFLERS